VVISNCVINLSPNKARVFQEAWRVLRPGGRLMVSDLVLLKNYPILSKIISQLRACIAGASLKDDYLKLIKDAGFQEVEILEETTYPLEGFVYGSVAKTVMEKYQIPLEQLKEVLPSVVSLKVTGKRPRFPDQLAELRHPITGGGAKLQTLDFFMRFYYNMLLIINKL